MLIQKPPTQLFNKLQIWCKKTNTTLKSIKKASQIIGKEKLFTLAKPNVRKSAIVSSHSSPREKMNLDNPSEEVDKGLQETTKVKTSMRLCSLPLRENTNLNRKNSTTN